MHFNPPIAIPIFYKNEDTNIQDQFEELGIKTEAIPLEDYDIRQITFYNIDAVSQYFNNDKEYSRVPRT